MQQVLGVSEVVGKNGPVPVDSIDADYFLLYFSASWCPPCKMFTPLLSDFYAANKDAKKFEVIFVSFDRDEASFKTYYNTQADWLALHGPACQKLGASFGVSGIPALLVFDKTGKLVTKEGRQGVLKGPETFPWA